MKREEGTVNRHVPCRVVPLEDEDSWRGGGVGWNAAPERVTAPYGPGLRGCPVLAESCSLGVLHKAAGYTPGNPKYDRVTDSEKVA